MRRAKNKMKLLYKCPVFVLFVVVLLDNLLAQVAPPPPYEVLSVSLSCDGKITNVFVETTRKPSAKAFYIPGPLRFVIDLENAILKMPPIQAQPLPEGLFSKLSISQYRGGKNPVVRVVMFANSRIEDFTQNATDNRLEVRFQTPGYPPFSLPESTKAQAIPPVPPRKEEKLVPVSAKAESVKPTEAQPESVPPPVGEVKGYKRAIVTFTYEGRDPFVPQTPTKEVPFGSEIYPNVEAISLVGIIQDGATRKALLEDTQGFGYLLGVGDSVENGYVKSVGERSVTFQVEEFGWTRTVTLEMPKGPK